jgi:hypothetical protein
MRILLAAILILSITTIAYAKDVFPDKELKNIQLVETTDGKALILSKDGTHAEVEVGDTIGNRGGKVIEVQKAYIMVETGTTKTRILKGMEFEK